MHKLASLSAELKSKVQDASSAISNVRERVTQQMLEGTGLADKTEDEEFPELEAHARIDAFLRRLYDHSDKYMRALNQVVEMSRILAEDFASVIDDPHLSEVAEAFKLAKGEEAAVQKDVLGQVLYRNVFQPVKREVEGRKDYERRLNDRRKVRLDYDAFRRKQMALMQSDPTNKSVYENNLEAARRTYAKHSENVLKDAAAVNAERKQLLSIAFAGLAVSQLEFFSCAANSLEAVAAAASAAVSNADDHPHDHSPAALWGRMRSEIQKMGHHARQQRAAKVAQRPPQQNKQPSPPPRHQQPQRTATQPPPSDTPQQRGSPDPHARAGGYVPPATQRVPTQEEHDPFGFGTAAPAPPPPRAAASPPPAQEANLFNFGDDSSPASVMAPPTISNESQPEFDLLSGMIGPPQVSHTPSLAVNDLMNDSGASAMDELMSLGAPAALVPETSSHRPRSAASASAVAAHDDFAAFMGGPATVKPQPARASPPFAPEGDLMGGMEDLLGGMGTPELLGGMAGSGAPRSGASLGSGGTERSALGPDGRPLSRQQLAARREAEKAAAIAAKVEEQRTRAATAEQNRETERDLEKVVGARVAQWQRDKKNLRALLASLHEIAPPCSWEPMSLGQLIDPAACKKAYRKAILAVHPDKQDGSDLQKKVLAQHVFDALREAWNVYQKTG